MRSQHARIIADALNLFAVHGFPVSGGHHRPIGGSRKAATKRKAKTKQQKTSRRANRRR
jgi:hypothetical protein